MHRADRRTARLVLGVASAIAAAVALPGCYRKVIRAPGPGADQYEIEESDRDNVVLPYLEPKDKKK